MDMFACFSTWEFEVQETVLPLACYSSDFACFSTREFEVQKIVLSLVCYSSDFRVHCV